MERIIVVGPSGSGKSTLAAETAALLACPHVELDALWWEAGWTEAGPERFRDRLDAIAGSRWVVDGNYFSGGTREHLWPHADTIVWLDLPRRITVPRVVRRSVGRVTRRTELWNGNRETAGNVLARDSVVWFAWRMHPRTRQRYEEVQLDPLLGHLTWFRLRSPADVERWLTSIRRGGPAA